MSIIPYLLYAAWLYLALLGFVYGVVYVAGRAWHSARRQYDAEYGERIIQMYNQSKRNPNGDHDHA